MARPLALITGIAGKNILPAERRFIKNNNPYGFILFKRNCDNPQQISKLTAELRELTGRRNTPILIDQEGGRVMRLRGENYAPLPPMKQFGDLYKKNPVRAKKALALNIQIIAAELLALGIDVDCIPVLDIPVRGADNIIGDRAFSTDPEIVSMLGNLAVQVACAAGLTPIVKHIPGHGRAMCDSHLDLPIVTTALKTLEATDFVPFRALKHAPWAMLAHVVYTALDDKNPASLSPAVIKYIRAAIGFDGVLIGDDLSMKALRGSYQIRATKTLAAGADLALHCNGVMAQMEKVAEGCHEITPQSAKRLRAARTLLSRPKQHNLAELLAARDKLLLNDS
jgi:beta-N-acetylhexosaminidase